jgi:5-methylcytosine-specific restriction enzyme B
MPYISSATLTTALGRLWATADHMLKIWFTLKQMGMTAEQPVSVTTSSPNDALHRLFFYGNNERLCVPFAHTSRFYTMDTEAGRSIIQTTIRRWIASGSVVGVNPTAYLGITEMQDGSLLVQPSRSYPQGLGYGDDGFALRADGRVAIPLQAFAVWYYRQAELPAAPEVYNALRVRLASDLNLTPAESELIFVEDDPEWELDLQDTPLTDAQVSHLVEAFLATSKKPQRVVIREAFEQHIQRVRSMTSITTGPRWLANDPKVVLKRLVDNGSKAILLYGPPRTGKTRAVDLLMPRNDASRETIQIHEGWGYDELMLGLRPDASGTWEFRPGPLLNAIRDNKKWIVLEEINRTDFSQSIGEVLSLIETAYRGEEHSIQLRNGEQFFIPKDTLIICTMNSLDRSTEEIDDAVLGRMDAVEFVPRVEDLHELLRQNGLDEKHLNTWAELFATILPSYPLGHGYFSGLTPEMDPVSFYLTRIRPVIQKHLSGHRDTELGAIDEKVDQLFS